jgi:hypothetical protein
MFALPPEADLLRAFHPIRYVPTGDNSKLNETTGAARSVP